MGEREIGVEDTTDTLSITRGQGSVNMANCRRVCGQWFNPDSPQTPLFHRCDYLDVHGEGEGGRGSSVHRQFRIVENIFHTK